MADQQFEPGMIAALFWSGRPTTLKQQPLLQFQDGTGRHLQGVLFNLGTDREMAKQAICSSVDGIFDALDAMTKLKDR
ncbi:MAG: hypothetical protein A2Y38_19485 [Spirochaetes bacterium GWB1_59_5]|nr:MAG: hypothetical protein A2Y38_19485 [Spirochaetes bacterium GWB1_59_5]